METIRHRKYSIRNNNNNNNKTQQERAHLSVPRDSAEYLFQPKIIGGIFFH